MKNKANKTKLIGKQNQAVRNMDWGWLFIHFCVLYLFGKNAIKHESFAVIMLTIVCAVVFIFRDLAMMYKWWLFTDPPNPKYLKAYMLYMAVELMFAFFMGWFGKLWNEFFLLLMFAVWILIIIPEAVKILRATYFIIKRWSKFWPRVL